MINAKILEGFTKKYLLSSYDNPNPVPDFHMDIWELFCGPAKLAAVAAPRGHSKSTAVSLAYLLANIVFQERKHILIISDTEDQSKDFLEAIREQILYNEELKYDFDINSSKPLDVDAKTELIINFNNGHMSKVIAKGSRQRIRGRIWKNTRFDLVIGDDLEDDKEVLNPTLRLSLRRWFRSAVGQALSDNGIIRLVGTILHSDSLLESKMPENQFRKNVTKAERDKWLDIGDVKVSSSYPLAPWKSIRYRAHTGIDDYSTILWEGRFNEERLRAVQDEYLADYDPEGYCQEYLNMPIDESRSYFLKQDMMPMEDRHYTKPKQRYCGVDFAISTKQRADFTVFLIAGVDSEDMLNVENVLRGRMDALEIIESFFSVFVMYRGIQFIIEKGAIWESIKPQLEKEMATRGMYLDYVTVASTTDKETRNKPSQHRVRAKAVRFDKESLWWPELEAEFTHFPRGSHDDQVDAFGNICRIIQKLTYKDQDSASHNGGELEDDFYDDDFNGEWDQGGSWVCGY